MCFKDRWQRKADQEWELAGLARRDGDAKAAAEHTRRARAYQRGEEPDAETYGEALATNEGEKDPR